MHTIGVKDMKVSNKSPHRVVKDLTHVSTACKQGASDHHRLHHKKPHHSWHIKMDDVVPGSQRKG